MSEQSKKAIKIVFGCCLGLAIGMCVIANPESNPSPADYCKTVSENNTANPGPSLSVTIVKVDDLSYGGRDRVKVTIMIDETDKVPDLAVIERIACYAWKEHGAGQDELYTFIYLPGMDVNKIVYGKGDFTRDGIMRTNPSPPAVISINEHSLELQKDIAQFKRLGCTRYDECPDFVPGE